MYIPVPSARSAGKKRSSNEELKQLSAASTIIQREFMCIYIRVHVCVLAVCMCVCYAYE